MLIEPALIVSPLARGYQTPADLGGRVIPLANQLTIASVFPPEYPSRALMHGIEGCGIVGFNLSAAGSVGQPLILESEPNQAFDRSSINGIGKFKYRARKIDGGAVSTDVQPSIFIYKLD
ncbi:MAG: TonB family protein [Arenicella sp.]|jgi:TonB family protein